MHCEMSIDKEIFSMKMFINHTIINERLYMRDDRVRLVQMILWWVDGEKKMYDRMIMYDKNTRKKRNREHFYSQQQQLCKSIKKKCTIKNNITQRYLKCRDVEIKLRITI